MSQENHPYVRKAPTAPATTFISGNKSSQHILFTIEEDEAKESPGR
jgi:hypothetical protein